MYTWSKRICFIRIKQIRVYFHLIAFALLPETEVGGRKSDILFCKHNVEKTEGKINTKDISALIIL
jgi:hypothetical protein